MCQCFWQASLSQMSMHSSWPGLLQPSQDWFSQSAKFLPSPSPAYLQPRSGHTLNRNYCGVEFGFPLICAVRPSLNANPTQMLSGGARVVGLVAGWRTSRRLEELNPLLLRS